MSQTVKQLIKTRNFRFLHPKIVRNATDKEIASILKSVGYFRNFSIFKCLYTLLYKSKTLSLENYRNIYEILTEYKETHPSDFFINGFSSALSKSSKIGEDVKALYGIMIYNIMNKNDSRLFPQRLKLEKAIEDYYNNSKYIELAVIRKNKVLKITNENLIKSIVKLCNNH